jgi:hypothetical protein
MCGEKAFLDSKMCKKKAMLVDKTRAEGHKIFECIM